jgi:hypothetical protein
VSKKSYTPSSFGALWQYMLDFIHRIKSSPPYINQNHTLFLIAKQNEAKLSFAA